MTATFHHMLHDHLEDCSDDILRKFKEAHNHVDDLGKFSKDGGNCKLRMN